MLNSNLIWLVLGVVLHTIFALSIFDIYFVSPIVDIKPIPLKYRHSKRVVIAVADGLRHDTFYNPKFNNNTALVSPFVFSKVFQGAYGTSLCSVPTESRPGHMSLFCGITEDPSAVLKGWSKNPVEVDCIFNNTNSYLFGDLGITHTYVPHIELYLENGHLIGYDDKHYIDGFPQYDFKTDYLRMNKFVRDGVFNLFEKAKSNSTLLKQLHEPSIFFFHFCGVDSAGHAFRPHSVEYVNTVKQVDKYLEEISVLFNSFYGQPDESETQNMDSDTTWIYTADHGMSDRGSHGDSDPNSVKTPFVIWGPRIKPSYHSNPHELSAYEDYYKEWLEMNRLQYNIKNNLLPSPLTINQIDIASLISVSMGISIPSNNLGTIPWLLLNQEYQYPALLSNYNQLRSLMSHKEHEKQLQHRYWRFTPFNSTTDFRKDSIPDLLKTISSVKQGIQYYQTYDKLFVQLLVTSGYVLWIACSALKFLTSGRIRGTQSDINLSLVLWTTSVIIAGFRATTWSHVGYIMLNTILLTLLIPLRYEMTELSRVDKILEILFCLLWTSALSQSFIDGTVLSYFYFIVGPLYLLFSSKLNNLLFCIFALLLAFFPYIPIPNEAHVLELTASGLFACFIGFVINNRYMKTRIGKSLGYVLLICALGSVVLLNDQKQNNLTWGLLLLPVITVLTCKMSDLSQKEKIIGLYLGCLPLYIILSLKYEPLFYSVYFVVLFMFYLIEKDASQQGPGVPYKLYLRLGMFLLLFIYTSFFSTGNLASFGSFSLASIDRFTTKFDPFLMGALLLLKILIPFILTSAVVYGVAITWHIKPVIIYFTSVAFSDIMTIRFFYSIRTQGSWLEMGTSMTRYLIASLFIVILLILFGIAKIVMN